MATQRIVSKNLGKNIIHKHEEIADKYQITSIPSILVFSTKNIEIEEKITNCSVKEITKLCKKYE